MGISRARSKRDFLKTRRRRRAHSRRCSIATPIGTRSLCFSCGPLSLSDVTWRHIYVGTTMRASREPAQSILHETTNSSSRVLSLSISSLSISIYGVLESNDSDSTLASVRSRASDSSTYYYCLCFTKTLFNM